MKIKYWLSLAVLILAAIISCKKSTTVKPKPTECTDPPTLAWENILQSTTNSVGFSIDASGNSYIGGFYNGTTSFGSTSLTGKGSFIAKMDSKGNYLYAKQITVLTSVTVYGLNPDSLQNLYVSYNSLGSGNVILFNLIKYDPSGNLLWTEQFNTGQTSRISTAVKVDKTGNIYIAGNYANSIAPVDFDPGTGVTNLPNSGTGYLLALDPNGNFLWVKKNNAPIQDYSVVASSSNFYLIDEFTNPNVYSIEKFDAQGDSVTTETLAHNSGFLYVDNKDNFYLGETNTIKKFDSNLNPVLNINTTNFNGFTIDLAGNFYLMGNFTGTVNFNPKGTFNMTAKGASDSFLEKLNSSGGFVWATQSLGVNSTNYTNSSDPGFTVDNAGNIIGIGTVLNGSSGTTDTYFAQYNQCH